MISITLSDESIDLSSMPKLLWYLEPYTLYTYDVYGLWFHARKKTPFDILSKPETKQDVNNNNSNETEKQYCKLGVYLVCYVSYSHRSANDCVRLYVKVQPKAQTHHFVSNSFVLGKSLKCFSYFENQIRTGCRVRNTQIVTETHSVCFEIEASQNVCADVTCSVVVRALQNSLENCTKRMFQLLWMDNNWDLWWKTVQFWALIRVLISNDIQ